MSNGFNFGGFETVKPTAVGGPRPWNIYENVKFGGISDVIKGKRQDGSEWRAWDFVFEFKEGKYTERFFEPTNNERKSYKDKNGVERWIPSNHESNLVFIAQVIAAFTSTGLDILKKNGSKIDGYDTLIGLVKKILNEKTDKSPKLKLVGKNNDGKIFCGLPVYCRISKDGNPYTSDTFIGDAVAFSNYELDEKKKYETAAPTKMADTEAPSDSKSDKGSENVIDDFAGLMD